MENQQYRKQNENKFLTIKIILGEKKNRISFPITRTDFYESSCLKITFYYFYRNVILRLL